MSSELADYAHAELNQEVTAIGGSYVLTKEARLPMKGREFLYLTGHAVFDTSCCGDGGCGYALVPGMIVEWRYRTNEAGLPVSKVEPIRDPALQEKIKRLILETEMVNQVSFL